MDAVFVELPPFEAHREEYMDDRTYADFQQELMKDPEAGDVIQGTGGLRKIRFKDSNKGKGKRGGIRVIYYWWSEEKEFLLFQHQSIRQKTKNKLVTFSCLLMPLSALEHVKCFFFLFR